MVGFYVLAWFHLPLFIPKNHDLFSLVMVFKVVTGQSQSLIPYVFLLSGRKMVGFQN